MSWVPQPPRTHCRLGHPITEDARGVRRCRTCQARRNAESYQRNRGAKPAGERSSRTPAPQLPPVTTTREQRVAAYAAVLVSEGWPAERATRRAADAFAHRPTPATFDPTLPLEARRAFIEHEAQSRGGG